MNIPLKKLGKNNNENFREIYDFYRLLRLNHTLRDIKELIFQKIKNRKQLGNPLLEGKKFLF